MPAPLPGGIAVAACVRCHERMPCFQMLELQRGFMVLADTMIERLDRNIERESAFSEDKRRWEDRLVELDTVNRSHIEHLDRKFHELNLWQQRVESMAQGVYSHSEASCTVFVSYCVS
jgi:hypothetical protein